jgi:hypothetical protein
LLLWALRFSAPFLTLRFMRYSTSTASARSPPLAMAISPRPGPATNTLVWLEVMCGQFYLAVVVATIVGIKMSQALAAPRDSG